jgi:hypothetical protein
MAKWQSNAFSHLKPGKDKKLHSGGEFANGSAQFGKVASGTGWSRCTIRASILRVELRKA